MQIKTIDEITSRHIAKALQHLKDVETPQCAVDAVRRQIWFLKDDLMDKVNQGDQDDCQECDKRSIG